MSFKEELDAAIAARDELLEQRKTATGEERAELDSKLEASAEEVRTAFARVEEEREIEEIRAKSPLNTPRVRTEERSNDEAEEVKTFLNSSGPSRSFRYASTEIEHRAVLGSNASNYSNAAFADKVLKAAVDRATITKAGAVAQIDQDGNPYSALAVDDIDTALTARNSDLTDTTDATTVTLKAYLFGGIVPIDNAQLRQSANNVVQGVAYRAGVKVSNDLNGYLLTGNGTDQPFGVLNASNGGSKGADAPAASLNVGVLAELFGSLNGNDQDASWIMNAKTFGVINSLTGSIWNVDPRTGFNTLFGRPVIFDSRMPDVGASNKSIIFGDFRNGYHLRVVGGVDVQVLHELYAKKNQTGVKVTLLADGMVTDSNLVKYLQHAAS